ncbi:MAG: peroxiredoxin [Candidatus Korarchaeum sp.]|nr:peroxiredoxin [Candidatus Korarchaeum sp.]
MIDVGSVAPDFKLPDQFREEVTLSKFRGKKVLLLFHPSAWTNLCEEQIRELESIHEQLEELGTVPLSISVDPVPSKRAWAKHMGVIKTTLLSDFWPHGEVSKKYGLFDEDRGVSKRAIIIIDQEGRVIYAREYRVNEKPDVGEVLRFLREVSGD